MLHVPIPLNGGVSQIKVNIPAIFLLLCQNHIRRAHNEDGNEMYSTAEGIELAIAEMELGEGWDMAIEVSYSIFSISGQRVDRGRVANCFDTVISIS